MATISKIDGYKLDHRRQYPEGTEYVYSNFTPRSSRINSVNDVVFIGLQYFLDKYLNFDSFFGGERSIDDFINLIDSYFGKNSIGKKHYDDLYNLGYLPLEFKALPEGTLVPLGVPMFTVENTHPDFFWLVNYIETILSCILWMPCTSATSAYRMKNMLEIFSDKTCESNEFVKFQAHDFSFRGMSGLESAQLSGIGHLSSFYGTDTIPAIEFIKHYYGNKDDDYIIGCSVPATEHSVMCAGGYGSERETFERILDLYPTGIVSIVSDTWDLWNVLTNIIPSLKQKILSRDGKLVIRPDSGLPGDIICGNSCAPEGTPERFGVINLLFKIFGGTVNQKGYKVLNEKIGVIYGDAITYDGAKAILSNLEKQGIASSNIVFGVGSYTYQYVTRDTFGFAMKATWCQINGIGMDIYKKPVTDNGDKFSAKGRLSIVKDDLGKLKLIEKANILQEEMSLLKTVWKDGIFIKKLSFDDVRENIEGKNER